MGEETLRSELVHDGEKLGLRQDVVRAGGGTQPFDYLLHPGGVAVVALDHPGERVLLVRQYRRPVDALLWQLPMGFRDRDGEPAEAAARRELAEEAGAVAESWERLAVLHPSPGVSNERVEVFLATGVTAGGPTDREPGEAGMTTAWWPLPDARAAARDGRITCAITIAGLLLSASPPSGPPGGRTGAGGGGAGRVG